MDPQTQLDRQLRAAGITWRARQPSDDLPAVSDVLVERRRPTGRARPALVAALVAVCALGVGSLVYRSSEPPNRTVLAGRPPSTEISASQEPSAPVTETGTPGPPSSGGAGPAPADRCTGRSFAADGTTARLGVGLGHLLVELLIRNTGDTPCRLDGYPVLALAGKGDGSAPLRTTKSDAEVPTSSGPGTLAPDEYGVVTLDYPNGSGPDPRCGVRGAALAGTRATLRLTFPDGTSTSVTVTDTADAPGAVGILAGCAGTQSPAGRSAYPPSPIGT